MHKLREVTFINANKIKIIIFIYIFNRYRRHIGVSEGGLVWRSITISFLALQYKFIGIGARSCHFLQKFSWSLFFKNITGSRFTLENFEQEYSFCMAMNKILPLRSCKVFHLMNQCANIT